ncbi:Asparagine--tRNA ligase [Candidatus Magnetomorum sp. HK-1]|nr:Asparagine--tRNA ligase [Candidatus Magnetomorum sp. HK-1]
MLYKLIQHFEKKFKSKIKITILEINVKLSADYYFIYKNKFKHVDLYMITPSISSPMGPGSDSIPVAIKFGNLDSFLVDSSQFGFEPLLLNGMDKVYCYLPSIRGEEPDKRHLNQFFNCEAEIKGGMDKLYPLIEGFVKTLIQSFLLAPNLLERLSLNYNETILSFNRILKLEQFPEITFDEAVNALVKDGFSDYIYINFTDKGRDIKSDGELKLAEIFNFDTPFWIKNFDRDRVPFYQKPHKNNNDRVICRDMIFPPIIKNSFGGEVVGSGERQNNHEIMLESLARQNVNPKPYEWYINLRRLPKYETTSGFGLGVERFITWSLCRDNIRDVILYPRILNVETYP